MISDNLLLSNEVINELNEVIKNFENNSSNKKVLFIGEEGTGKTECVYTISSKLKKETYFVNNSLFNINKLIKNINNNHNDKIIVFDEIENILIKHNKIQKRKVKKFKKILNSLNKNIILIVTTNVPKTFDNEFMSMFDYTINFDNYSIDFLLDAADLIVKNENELMCNKKLLDKVLTLFFPFPTPIQLKKLLLNAISLSDKNKPYDYLRILYLNVNQFSGKEEIEYLYQNWFDIDEIEILTQVNKNDINDVIKG